MSNQKFASLFSGLIPQAISLRLLNSTKVTRTSLIFVPVYSSPPAGFPIPLELNLAPGGGANINLTDIGLTKPVNAFQILWTDESGETRGSGYLYAVASDSVFVSCACVWDTLGLGGITYDYAQLSGSTMQYFGGEVPFPSGISRGI